MRGGGRGHNMFVHNSFNFIPKQSLLNIVDFIEPGINPKDLQH